jgi:uncharacterized membrane protein YtjA (UPF0391 family)
MKNRTWPTGVAEQRRASRVGFIVWCRECRHQVVPDPAEMAARVRRQQANRDSERNGTGHRWVFQPKRETAAEDRMLKLALFFLIVSIIAGLFGFTGISAAAAGIAKVLFFIFIVAFLVFLILGLIVGSALF